MKIKLLGDRVLVEKYQESSSSNFIIPETVFNLRKDGVIVHIGNGEELAKLKLKIGDRIIFEAENAEGIKLDGKDCAVIPSEKIIAVVDN
jgi:co-chaperonin GroES (HSP10)